MISGARYSGVPHRVLVRVPVRTFFTNPKSAICISFGAVGKKLSIGHFEKADGGANVDDYALDVHCRRTLLPSSLLPLYPTLRYPSSPINRFSGFRSLERSGREWVVWCRVSGV